MSHVTLQTKFLGKSDKVTFPFVIPSSLEGGLLLPMDRPFSSGLLYLCLQYTPSKIYFTSMTITLNLQ